MSKSTLPWFRFYTETISDTKFDVISNHLHYSKISLLGTWAALLSLASKSPERGCLLVTSTIPYTVEDLAAICGTEIDWMDDVIGEFLEMDMLETVDGCYIIKNWNKRQFESDSSTDRVREFRDRYSNVTVTPPDTDTDTDTESLIVVVEENPEKTNIFKLHEQEFGIITSMIADELKEIEKEYPPDWIEQAFKVCVNQNIRKLSYLKGVLKNWKVNGFGTDPPSNKKYSGNGSKPIETPAQKMVREERERLQKGLSP